MQRHIDFKKASKKKSIPKVFSDKVDNNQGRLEDFIFVPTGKNFLINKKKILFLIASIFILGGIFYLSGNVFSLNLPNDPYKALEFIFKQNEKVKSARFTLSTVIDDKILEEKPINLKGLSIETEGSLIYPDKIKTKSRYQANDPLARTIFLKNFDFETIIIGEKKFQKNFLEDYWREGINTFELGKVNNPLDYLKYARYYKNVRPDVESRVDGFPSYRFNYEVDVARLDVKTRDALNGASIKVSLWADKENFFIRRLRTIIEFPEDSKKIDALIDFKDFNDKSIIIEEPRGV